MNTWLLIGLFILGAALGSGLLALAKRLQAGRSWRRGRSRCLHCDVELTTIDLVPLASFVYLSGRCRHCKEPISWQYPLVELAAGGLLVLSHTTFGLTVGFIAAALLSLILLFIYIYDAQTMLIPDAAVWTFNGLAFILLFINLNYGLAGGTAELFIRPEWLQLAAGPLVALPLFFIWLASRGRAMGFGDVKLALGIGWLLGLAGGFSALVYAFWIGAGVSLALLAWQWLWKKLSPNKVGEPTMNLTTKSAVPFGPFLILGSLLVLFGNILLF